MSDVLIKVENVSKKFCRDLKKSLWYGVKDIAGELSGRGNSRDDLRPGEFIHTLGDLHIYQNHREQVELQLSRIPRTPPLMRLNPDVKKIRDFRYEDFELSEYEPYPSIRAPIAV